MLSLSDKISAQFLASGALPIPEIARLISVGGSPRPVKRFNAVLYGRDLTGHLFDRMSGRVLLHFDNVQRVSHIC
jgi:hypothetical protein